MTEAYEAEQATLTERVNVLRRELVTAKEETEGVDKFLRIVRKYTEIAELTPETVREFIDRISGKDGRQETSDCRNLL